MTVEELNKLIKEELSAFFENEDEEVEAIDAGDDIEVTTDEPAMETGEEAIDLLRQIYDLIKPEIEGEAGEEVELDDEEAETEDIEDEEIGDGEDDEEGLDESQLNEDASMEMIAGIAKALGVGIPIAKGLLLASGPITIGALSLAITKLQKLFPKAADALAKVAAGSGAATGITAGSTSDTRESVGYPNYKAGQVSKVKADATDVNQGLNESVGKKPTTDFTDRFQKLANIKK